MSGNRELAADVVQEVFVRMLRKLPHFVNPGAEIAWLRRTTSNLVIDMWRMQRPVAATEEPASAALSASLEASETAVRVRGAMARLSEQQRLVLMCKCYDDLTFREIASELDLSVPTVKTHYLRGLRALRGMLESSQSGASEHEGRAANHAIKESAR
jgi:RNA polymerase sigma-70 factor (ECF subfamily)